MQMGFYFDQSRCVGCYVCVAACRSWNQLDQEMPNPVEIRTREQGEFPILTVTHLFLTCFHCAEPPCIPACPEGLLVKRSRDGIVVISDAERCTGCQLCAEACPYNAPKPVVGSKKNIIKCNLCLGRLSQGKAPACVSACPTWALEAGPMEELIAKHEGRRELDNFPDYRRTNPSVIFRTPAPKK